MSEAAAASSEPLGALGETERAIGFYIGGVVARTMMTMIYFATRVCARSRLCLRRMGAARRRS